MPVEGLMEVCLCGSVRLHLRCPGIAMNLKVRIYTTRWCSDCWRAKQFLKRHGLNFEEINIEEVPEAAEFLTSVSGGKRRVPTFEMEGRVFYFSPFDPVLLGRELGIASSDSAGAIGPGR